MKNDKKIHEEERITNEGADVFTDKFQDEDSIVNKDVTKGYFDMAYDFDIFTGRKTKNG